MIETCLDCVRKHIDAAMVAMEEVYLGYPIHRQIAIGHLVHAESESLKKHPAFARVIRNYRVKIGSGHAAAFGVRLFDLSIYATHLAGEDEDLHLDPRNQKLIDIPGVLARIDEEMAVARKELVAEGLLQETALQPVLVQALALQAQPKSEYQFND